MLLKRHLTAARNRSMGCGGWTLAEMVIAVGAGTIILLAFVSAFVTLSNTMVAITNYNALDASSRNTLDQMGQDLRDTAVVTSMSLTSVTVTNADSSGRFVTISYSWNPTNTCFTRQLTSGTNGTITTVMLTNCDNLIFAGYTRVPTNYIGAVYTPFSFVTNSSGNPQNTKLISVSWRCSRTILGVKLNTESVQTARICIRN